MRYARGQQVEKRAAVKKRKQKQNNKNNNNKKKAKRNPSNKLFCEPIRHFLNHKTCN